MTDLEALAKEVAEDLDDRGGEAASRSGGVRTIREALLRVRREALEAAIKATCTGCSEGHSLSKHFLHPSPLGDVLCDAVRIRALLSEGETT